MHLAPVGTHLLAVLAAGIKVGDLIGTEHVVHIFGQLGLQRGHNGKLLADKNLGKQLMRSSEYHGLFLEVLNMSAFGEELGHIVYTVPRLFGKPFAGAGENGGTHEYGHIRKFGD